MKKFLALMALLLCFTVLFVACDNNDEPTPTDAPSEAPSEQPAGCEHEYDNACDVVCNLCGEQRAPANHVEETIAGVAPTCTKDGLTDGKVCTVCGVVTVEQQVAPATGHAEVVVAGVAPTCTTAGKTEGKVCSTCNAVVVAQEVLFATGHNVEVVEGVAATCTTDGLTSGKKCSVCDVWVQEQAVIPATGHAESTVPSVDATCTTDGYVGATVCTVCNEVLEAERVLPKLGHTEVEMPDVPSTCVKAGTKGGTMCITCGEVLVEPTPAKLAKHTAQKVSGYEPTCTTAGLSDGTVCKVCGEIIKAQTVIPATHGELVAIEEVLPTCTTVGYTGGSKCSVCDAVVEAQTVVPYAHTYSYTCSETCDLCGYVRSTEPMHVWGTANNGELCCVYGCGTAYADPTLVPATFTSGEALYNRVILGGALSSAYTNGYLSYNEEGYITVSGADTNGDPGMDHVLAVPFGPAWDGEGQAVTQQYLVMRYRTDTAGAEIRFVTWNVPIMVCIPLGTAGEWQTVVIDLTDIGQNGERIDIRCNIGANTTDFSHFASFSTAEEAAAYATNLSYIVDNKCPHTAYEVNWANNAVCTNCYETVVPTTSHVGSEVYDAIDPNCADYALITDNGRQGVAVNGVGTSLGGLSANLTLVNDTNFGGYMVVVYKMDTGAAFLGVGANGNIASYVEAAQVPNKWTVGNYGMTRSEGNTLELVCNYAGASNVVGIYAVYTFDSAAEATAYAATLANVCYHDETTVEAGRVTCTACGAVQGATAEWPIEFNSGWLTTPEFVAGTSLANPGIQEYHYVCEIESDARLIVEAGDNVSVIVNGYYVDSTVDVFAGDIVEIVVYAVWDEETWELITDPVGFPVEIALPGTANNPFDFVIGSTTTPEFVAGTSLSNPGVQEYTYKWVADGNGKFTVSEMENVSWTVNGVWVDGFTAEVAKGDIVEITVYALRDENNAVITTPVAFSVEFDVNHEIIITETGAITCNKGCHEAIAPTTYTSGSDIYYRATELQTTVSGVTYTQMPCVDNGDYVTITGAGNNPAAALNASGIFSVAQGGAYEGGTPVIQRYLVMRVRTNAAFNLMYIVTYNGAAQQPWCNPVDIGAASQGEWTTLVIDLFGDASVGFRVDIALNIGAEADTQTDISHIASFTTVDEASAYASALGKHLDGACPHTAETGFDELGSVRCTQCGLIATPKTYQAGAGIYGVVDSTSQDYALVTNGGDAGITVSGTGTHAYGTGANLKLTSATDFGQYMVVVYTVDATSYLGISVNDNIASYKNLPAASGLTILNYGATQASGNSLEIICNYAGASSATGIYGVVTFDTAEEAELFCKYLKNATGWTLVVG